MRNSLALLALLLIVGCVPVSRKDAGVDSNVDKEVARGVRDSVASKVVWLDRGIAHEDFEIDLGYRLQLADGARWLEPVATITRDGSSVANAMVFNSLTSADADDVLAEEKATVYCPSPNSDAAWYARGKLPVPAGTTRCLLHVRVVLPEGQQTWTRDLTIQFD